MHKIPAWVCRQFMKLRAACMMMKHVDQTAGTCRMCCCEVCAGQDQSMHDVALEGAACQLHDERSMRWQAIHVMGFQWWDKWDRQAISL